MANELELLVGPLLVLICFALILFGVFTFQVYFYWFTYEDDIRALRILVLVLWILECLHTCFCIHLLYTYLVVDFHNPEGILQVVWSAGVTVFLEVFIVSGAQGFYILRIWQLSGHNILATAPPAFALFCRIAFGFATGSLLYCYRTWPEFREHTGSLFTLNCGLTLAAFVDLLTTAILSYYLRRNMHGFERTRHVLQKLIFYTVNTGALTMVFSIAILFTFNFVTKSLMFAGMVEVVSKLYANSMLAMVNARRHLKAQVYSGTVNSIALQSPHASRPGAPDRVQVSVYREVLADAGSTRSGDVSAKVDYALA
ncbi:hypothetical protein PHLGIDRAFT_479385 [Phlebiopsis gigantea 11061_1 CR5-6]|uniref:DUF6534 domain-containing protein n=1 Tax=Phlebiopsis gigantea (strain 11061_1 CR5-6) TaxID=745531 RepID=A0A0C3PIU0_PHLG1|nr:hypothetical protein PHLGIDRAFT_479385 [Phlebiopsis gigantea 11061_1 CR5-6]